MCVVFLCITVTHGNDESPLSLGVILHGTAPDSRHRNAVAME